MTKTQETRFAGPNGATVLIEVLEDGMAWIYYNDEFGTWIGGRTAAAERTAMFERMGWRRSGNLPGHE